MIDNRTVSAIDLALQHPTPVGDLFAAIRHGRMKRCFSRIPQFVTWRSSDLELWAFLVSSSVIRTQVIHPLNPELSSWQRGAVTTEYFNAHQRTVRRLRRILARKREMQKWCKSGMPCTTAT
jgi:hypothetical protein